MTVDVKICGLKSREHVEAALTAGARWIGFVFHGASPRNVSARDVGIILSQTTPEAAKCAVGLFVKPSDQEIAEALAVAPLAILQIYDKPERAREIRARFGLPVWISVPVSDAASLPSVALCDGYVMEAAASADAARPGGNGRTFNWTHLREWHAPAPWILAGGLTPENVGDAIRTTAAPAVDVSSGVEVAPGEKSSALITRFLKAAHTSCA